MPNCLQFINSCQLCLFFSCFVGVGFFFLFFFSFLIVNQFVFPERKFFLKTLIYTNVAISDSNRAFFAFFFFFFGMLLKYLPFHPIAHTEFRFFFF